MIDPLVSLAFSVVESPGVYAVIVGSGVSRAAEIPTGWEITTHLARRLAALHDDAKGKEPVAWYRERFGKDLDYSDLLDQLAGTRDERRAILHHHIEPTDEERERGAKVPTNAHRAIARLVRDGYVRVVVTTNFDRLLETALKDEGIEPAVVASDDGVAGMVPLVHSACTVIKVHGDYLDTRILNTAAELSEYPERVRELLARVFDEFGLIICGWSGEWDGALRNAIQSAPARRYTTWWASRSALTGVAEDLARARYAKQIGIESADQFFSALHSKVLAAAESRRPHPASGDLAAAELKRLLRQPDHEIAVHDLVTREVRRLSDVLASDAFPMEQAKAPLSSEALVARVHRYVAETEVLRRMLAILGRWAANESVPLVTETMQSLLKATDTRGGLVVWVELHRYPAALCWNTFGTAAFVADDLQAISAVMRAEHRPEHKAPGAIGGWVHGWGRNLDLHNHDGWRLYPGLENHHTGCLDHVVAVLTSAAIDIVQRPETLPHEFDRFQALGSLIELDTAPANDRERPSIGRWSSVEYQTYLAQVNAFRASHRAFKSGIFGIETGPFGNLVDRCLEGHQGMRGFRLPTIQAP